MFVTAHRDCIVWSVIVGMVFHPFWFATDHTYFTKEFTSLSTHSGDVVGEYYFHYFTSSATKIPFLVRTFPNSPMSLVLSKQFAKMNFQKE